MIKFRNLKNITLILISLLIGFGVTAMATPNNLMVSNTQRTIDALNKSKTIWESWGGIVDSNNQSNYRHDTAWNSNNRVGPHPANFLTQDQANDKILHRIRLLKTIWQNFGGTINSDNQSDSQPHTAWNSNSRIGLHPAALLSPSQAYAKINYRINKLKTIWQNFGGSVSFDNAADGTLLTAWNSNNRIGRDHTTPFLTLYETYAKINYQINKLKTIWQNWGGRISYYNAADGTSPTSWNANNRLGTDHSTPFLTRSQANAKIDHRIDQLKTIWQNWGGIVSLHNQGDSHPDTAWNANNRIGSDHTTPLLTPSQANDKINHQINLLKTIWIDWGGIVSLHNQSDSHPDTAWNANNRIGNEGDAVLLTPSQADAKIYYQIQISLLIVIWRNWNRNVSFDNADDGTSLATWYFNNSLGRDHTTPLPTPSQANAEINRLINLSKTIWQNFGGIVSSHNQSDSEPNTAWNANNRIGYRDTDDFLTPSQADAKIYYQINKLKTIWQNWGGIVSLHNQSDSHPDTAWNDNNKISRWSYAPLLTPSQANAKINHRINLLKTIWQNLGGRVSLNNQSDSEPNTAWNANNRIGHRDTDDFLTPSQANAKIYYQINKLKTIWQNFGGIVSLNNQSDSQSNTPWNDNNKIGRRSYAPLLTPSQANAKINHRINLLKTIWQNFGGTVNSNNQSNSHPDTAWNANNRLGTDHSTPFLTVDQANAKINHRINLLKTIWQNFGGTVNSNNQSNSHPDTAWNVNNRIGADHSTPFLTPSQANAKIDRRINKLKTIWEKWDGSVSSDNAADGTPPTAWNVNNRIGADHSTPFLTQSQAIAKINHRINPSKTIWQNFGGIVSSHNQSDSQSDTAWNDNNRIGRDHSTPFLTPSQANHKINHRINLLKTIWQNWGGRVSSDNAADGTPPTPWNANNKIGIDHSSPFLSPSQGNAKIEHQVVQKLNELKAIFRSFAGEIDETNSSNQAVDSPWNANNKIGNEDDAAFLSLSQANAKIIQLMNPLRRIWESFAGEADETNEGDEIPNTSWNANNRIGADDSSPFLTPSQANAKINHQINLLKIIWESFAGEADENNEGDDASNTSWNANNRIGADNSTPFLTQSQANAKIEHHAAQKLEELKAIFRSFDGEIDETNSSNQAENTPWNTNNKNGNEDTAVFLTQSQANDKINYQIDQLKTIWQNLGGIVSLNNQSNAHPNTPWNANNRIGADDSTDFLTPPEANAKINHQINILLWIWESFGGQINLINSDDGEPNTPWNANNRIGAEDTDAFLTLSQSNAKINYQIDKLKTIWQSFAGDADENNEGDQASNTAWNSNNRIGRDHSTPFLTPYQADAKISYQLDQLKAIWESFSGSFGGNRIDRATANTPWNNNNKTGRYGTAFLTLLQANAKINYQINKLKTIWQSFGGQLDNSNSSNGEPNTPWNSNNKNGNQADADFLTKNQATAKIKHHAVPKLEELKAIWVAWGGEVSETNAADQTSNTSWNNNNRIGHLDTDAFLSLSQANAKIEHQIVQKLEELKTIWESFAGEASRTNTGNEAPNTPWNLNNRIGAEDTADFLSLSQANAKISNRIDDLKMIWESWGGVVNQTNSSNEEPNTPWNLNNKIGVEDTADFLTLSQANSKIEHQVVQKLEELKAIWIAWEGEVSETSVSNNEPSTPWNFNNRIGAEDTADFLTLSQANSKIEHQRNLKLNTFTVAGWSLVETVLTSDNNDKGTFVLTFSVADGTLKYTLANTESQEVADFWSAFNFDHQVATDASDANTPSKVETLINTAVITASATLSELAKINALFNDNTSWVLNGTVLTGTIENRGIFSLTFTIDANDGTLKYTLANTASEEVADFWSAFNSVHLVPKDVITANTVIKVETLINTAYSDATELAKINALFTVDEDTSWELFGTVLTTTIIGKGTFSLTFTINSDGTLEYTLANTETEEADTFWSTFNSAHEVAKDATAVSTVADVNTLINNAYNTAILKAINALFTADEDTSWEFDNINSWLTTTTLSKGLFKLTFTINANDGTLEYTLANTETEEADTFWSTFNSAHETAKDATAVSTVANVNTLINNAYNAATLKAINAVFTVDEDTSWELFGSVLTTTIIGKGTFSLMFTINSDETLEYTLTNIESTDDKIAFWSVFNSAHETAKDATAVNTVAAVNTLINNAYNTATLKAINAVFTGYEDNVWELTESVLTATILGKGTFSLTFTINTNDGTLEYTLANTETEEADTFWSTFNSAHETAKDAATLSTVVAVNTLINNAYNAATLKAINAVFTVDEDTNWELFGSVLTTTIIGKGTFSLMFTINSDETLEYTLTNIESTDEKIALWSAFNSAHNTPQTADDVSTVVEVEALIDIAFNTATNKATLTTINTLFADDVNTNWEFDSNNNWLTTTIPDRGLFKLRFTIDANTGTLEYTLANTETIEEKIAFWSVFNLAHNTPQTADDVSTVVEVEALIDIAFNTATNKATLTTINALFTVDEDTNWELFESVLTATILGKGIFSLTFTINSDGTLEYTLANTETIEKKIAFWSTLNTAHETAKDATAVSTVANVNTLINNAYNVATLKTINALFTADEDTSWELIGSVLTTTIDAKGTFSLTFTIDANDETLKYKIVQTAATEDADWTAFNVEHNVAKDASTADTVTKVQDLINTAHTAAAETRTALENERTTINALFTADAGWVLDGAVLTSVNNDKGTFKLTFSIEDGTLKYTLSEIANAADADWSAFNSANSDASDINDANTLAKINALIATGHTVATETAEATSKTETATTKTTEKAKGSAIGIIAIIIIASIALVAIMFLGYRFIKKRN